MPLFRLQLQRSVGVHLSRNSALFRSAGRPFSPNIATPSRHLHRFIAASSSEGIGSTSSGQGFGKSPTDQQKKQKLEVNNTADALLRSLGGTCIPTSPCIMKTAVTTLL